MLPDMGIFHSHVRTRMHARDLAVKPGIAGQSRCMEPAIVPAVDNVLGALHQYGKLVWSTLQRPTVRDDVIAFFEHIAGRPNSVPRIVILDNAAIHKGDAMVRKRRQLDKRELYLYYLPPYCLELSCIEILLKQAKYV